jgi:hypothetical protein
VRDFDFDALDTPVQCPKCMETKVPAVRYTSYASSVTSPGVAEQLDLHCARCGFKIDTMDVRHPINIVQTLTEGGSLYGYRDDEWSEHLRDHHSVDGVAFPIVNAEAFHLHRHERGVPHQHLHTETGALALTLKED